MAIQYPPKPGLILMCSFTGMKEPEMVKERPVIVLAASPHGIDQNTGKAVGLATVAALSTVEPNPKGQHHMEIPKQWLPMKGFFQQKTTWLKGDMIYSMSFDRLTLVGLGKDQANRRVYFKSRLGQDNMKKVYGCVLSGLNLDHLNDKI